MKILVIGGSYFYGRVFVMLASGEHQITVVNRGTYPMEAFGVKQITGDRHEASTWKHCGEDYDALVDFCAYEQGDIANVLNNLAGSVKQYILISTVDVYRRNGKTAGAAGEAPHDEVLKDESVPLELRSFSGEAGAYISGKVALEEELRMECGEKHVAYTVLRPAILYGPYNYAPRESLFIQMAVREHMLPRFSDAIGKFQFVYVKDAAEAILKCLGNEKSYGQAYNLCGDEFIDYDLFFRVLAACAGQQEIGDTYEGQQDGTDTYAIREMPMTLAEAGERGIPVPFPAVAEETELVSNQRSKTELKMEYTPLREGMQKTFNAFAKVWR